MSTGWKTVVITSLALNAVSISIALVVVASVGGLRSSIDGALTDSLEEAAN